MNEAKRETLVKIIAFWILLLIAGWFYWYEWRPAKIRGRCLAQVQSSLRVVSVSNDIERNRLIELEYKNCIRVWGLAE